MASVKNPNENKKTQHFNVKAAHGHFTNPFKAMFCTDYQDEDKLTRVVQLTDIEDKSTRFSFITDRSYHSPFSSPCGMAFDPKELKDIYHLIVNASESDDINGTITLNGKQIPAHLEKQHQQRH